MAQSSQGRVWTTKHLAWACIGSAAVGAILTYQAGFNWIGGWETGEDAQKKWLSRRVSSSFCYSPTAA